MTSHFPQFAASEDRFATILYRCLEAVGSTKGAFYLRETNGGFRCLTQYGWPRGSSPPPLIAAADPLLVMVKRVRRSFAVNDLATFPELEAFGTGSDSAHLFVSPVYLTGDWVGLLIQRDKQRHEPFDEEVDAAPTLQICNALAAELKTLRTPEPEPVSLPITIVEPPITLVSIEEPRPLHINQTMPMPLQVKPASAQPSAIIPLAMDPKGFGTSPKGAVKPSGEFLSGYKAELEGVAWEGESRKLPGAEPGTAPAAPKRQGMFLPEQRAYFWEMAGLMAQLVPCAALAFWMEEADEVRPILCYSPQPLSGGLKQQVLAHVTFNLPLVREQDLRLLTWSRDDAGPALEGGFATQFTLPLGKGSEDLLMVFRLEYAPLEDHELKALAHALRLLRQFLDESRTHEHYHQAFLSFAHRILAGAEGRSPGLSARSLECAKLSQAFAIHLDLPSSEAEALSIAGILHDVGGLMVDPAIQAKDALSEEDWKQIKAHPGHAAVFLRDLEFPFDVMAIIASHHERWDGKGYPAGLSAKAIPLGGRILAMVDAFESMTFGRAHKAPVSPEAAMAELMAGAGSQFDPDLVEAFVKMLAQKKLSHALPAGRT